MEKTGENNGRSNTKIYIAIIIALILLAVGFYLYYFYPQLIPGMASTSLKENINVLVIGMDDLESVKKGTISADSIIFAQLSTSDNKLTLTNIDMESEEFDEEVEKEKINNLIRKVEDLTSTNINYYFTISYRGFINIVDSLNGISIEREEALNIPDLEIDLKKGVNELSGREALNYARWYDYNAGEEDRIERQQQVIKSLVKKATDDKTLLDIPEIFNVTVDTFKSVKTNLGYTLVTDIVDYFMKNDITVSYNTLFEEDN